LYKLNIDIGYIGLPDLSEIMAILGDLNALYWIYDSKIIWQPWFVHTYIINIEYIFKIYDFFWVNKKIPWLAHSNFSGSKDTPRYPLVTPMVLYLFHAFRCLETFSSYLWNTSGILTDYAWNNLARDMVYTM
jgi:hypothetical protein